MSPLVVVTSYSNAVRYQSRLKLFHEFRERLLRETGVVLVVVEHALGERPFEATVKSDWVSDRELNVQVRNGSHVWLKENCVKLGIQRVPKEFRYIASVDADLKFVRPDWAAETVHQLQHHDAVQMFSYSQDVGPDYEPLSSSSGFAYEYVRNGVDAIGSSSGNGGYYLKKSRAAGAVTYRGHPGYAWAYTREFLDAVGNVLDFAILGAGDHHMAWALVGGVIKSAPPGLTPEYYDLLKLWQDRALSFSHRNVGYTNGTVIHYHHGPKAKRRYWDRWKILRDNAFSPVKDLRYDAQGVLLLDKTRWQIRDQILKYLGERDEDSKEV